MMKLFPAIAALLLAACASRFEARPAPPSEEEVQAAVDAVTQAMDDLLVELQTQSGYVWHRAEDGRSVQYGVPDTDDRAIRVDCENNRLIVMMPTSTVAAEGAPSSAHFPGGERREGSIAYLGDGPNVLVPIALEDPLVETLLAGERIAIDTPETVVRVPSAGGVTLLRALIQLCRRQGS